MGTTGSMRWGLLVAPVVLAACAATLSVSTQQYPQADFSRYKSYAWIAADPLIRPKDAAREVSPLTARRIREAIEATLAARGYRAADGTAPPDFVVAFTVGARDRIDAQSYPVAYRGPWLWQWYGSETDLRVYREGALSIDIFDGASRQPVWHGAARKEITSADTKDPGPAIERAVEAILARFPVRR